jgi:hypothetical protein
MFVTPTHVVDAARDYAAFGTLIDPSMPGSCCWSIREARAVVGTALASLGIPVSV